MLRLLFSSKTSSPLPLLRRESVGSSRSPAVVATTIVRSKSVVAALSGGVDSSVVAALLADAQPPSPVSSYSSALSSDHRLKLLAAVHCTNWNATSHDDDSVPAQGCSSESDWKDAQAVARHLNIPHIHRVNLEADYWTLVFEPYLREIERGYMGNPDMGCNRYIKFGALREFCAKKFGAETMIATGHYARLWHRDSQSAAASTTIGALGRFPVQNIPNFLEEELAQDPAQYDWILRWGRHENEEKDASLPPILLSAADGSKDQSYFLADCSSQAFSNIMFPLGDFYKRTHDLSSSSFDSQSFHHQHDHPQQQHQQHLQPTVRQLAYDFALPTAEKRESMGICFVGKRPSGFRHFLQNYLHPPTRPLRFIDVETQSVLSETTEPSHACLYTIGQGAKLSGSPQKYFVVSLNVTDNVVHVAAGTHHPALYTDHCTLQRLHWMAGSPPEPLKQGIAAATVAQSSTSGNATSHSSMRLQCRIRHLQPLVNCTLVVERDNHGGKETATIRFDQPMRGVTPGQYAVFYTCNGLVCLGGGPIEETGASYWHRGERLDHATAGDDHEKQIVA